MKKAIVPFVLSVFLFFSCKHHKNKTIPDVSGIPPQVKIIHFDDELFGIDTLHFNEGFAALEAKYPGFVHLYTDTILGFSSQKALSREDFMHGFVTYSRGVRMIYDTCHKQLGDMKAASDDILKASQYCKYYFPNYPQKDIFMANTAFNVAVNIAPDFTLIGKEMFLGSHYTSWYPPGSEASYFYINRTLNQQHLASWVVKAWVADIVTPGKAHTMLDFMINEGKKMYVVDALLPNAPDSVKLGWTQLQVNYLERSGSDLYKLLVNTNLLLSKDYDKFRKFVSPGPFNPEMASEQPGNSGSWLGWQMVKQYMDKVPGATMETMLKEKDSQKFLQVFKPQ